jgi:hypothetical protein
MNCDCLKDLETRLARHMEQQAGADVTARVMNTALAIPDDGPVYAVLNIPFRVKGSKKGYTSEKGKEIIVAANCCPFCARSAKHYAVGEDDGIAAAMPGASA